MILVTGVAAPIVRMALKRSDQTINNNVGIAGLTNASTGLSISVGADNGTAPTVYTTTAIQSIATIGTYAAPSAASCRFGVYDNVNGIYELQFLAAVFAPGAGARSLIVSVNAVAGLNLAQADKEIQLSVADLNNPATFFQTAMAQPSPPSVGSNPTAEQALTMVLQERLNYDYSTGLKTVYKYDGTTAAYTITLSATSTQPTHGVRAS